MSLSVFITVFNNLKGLRYSLDSIAQEGAPCDDFVVVVIDDGSQPAIDIQQQDYPSFELIVVHQENQGVEAAANAGLSYCQNLNKRYIARLDAGDECTNQRLHKQLAFLEEHPEYAVVGGAMDVIEQVSRSPIYTLHYPLSEQEIRNAMHVNCAFSNPAVMMRTSATRAVGWYSNRFAAAEDYDYLFRLVKKFPCANLPDVILRYEDNPSGISHSKRQRQFWSRIKIQLRYFDYRNKYSYYGLLRSIFVYLMPTKLIRIFRPRKGQVSF